MRIATWNVNSLPARLGKLWWWVERAAPDVLLLQETKIPNEKVPVEEFEARGYQVAHHGQSNGRNGVAIASRVGLSDVLTHFGEAMPESVDGDQPSTEARMIAATCGGVRLVSLYVPNGRVLDSEHYRRKLDWLGECQQWIRSRHDPGDSLVVGGDFNIAPTDEDVWDPSQCHGGTHVSEAERKALRDLRDWGLVDGYRLQHSEDGRYSWWDYRAGAFHKGWGMRIDLLLLTRALAERVVWAEIDREARKGKPIPSDHAPVVIDFDEPGLAFDARWARADAKRK